MRASERCSHIQHQGSYITGCAELHSSKLSIPRRSCDFCRQYFNMTNKSMIGPRDCLKFDPCRPSDHGEATESTMFAPCCSFVHAGQDGYRFSASWHRLESSSLTTHN